MSHNTVLVDGLGQFTGRNAATVPVAARLLAYHEGDGFVYWAGDATMAYPRAPGAVRFWWGGLDELYEARDARHLQRFHRHVLFVRDRYFVVLDDLVAQRPSRFSWLYHVLPEADLHLQADTGSFRYWVDDVAVHVTHVLGAGRVDAVDQAGRKGYVNPLTDEDYSEDLGRSRGRELVAAHNLYVTNREPTRNWRFLSTIVPVPAGADTPRTERLDELTARVTFLGQSEVISFDPSHTDADIVVDLRAIADGADGIRPR
jgi:hypothetical protein